MNMEQEVTHILQVKGLNDIIILGNMLAVTFFFFLLIFVIAKTWKQLKYHLPRRWIKIIFIHKIEHYLIIKKSEHHVNAKHTYISKTVLEWKKPDKNICTIWYVWYEIQKCIISKNMRREIYLKGSKINLLEWWKYSILLLGYFLYGSMYIHENA